MQEQKTERIRTQMESAISDLTDHLISKTAEYVSFEQIYGSIYRGILHKMGRVWFSLMYISAKRLVFEFRNDHEYYKRCILLMRDVSMFAEVTFCQIKPYFCVKEVFERVWDNWHSNQEMRARVLWRPVRTMRAKIAAFALFYSIYDEVSLRPKNTGYEKCKVQFDECVKKQKLN